MKFMLQLTITREPGNDWTEGAWPYERDMAITDALRDTALALGGRLDPLEAGSGERILDRSGKLIGEWKVVDE